DREISLHRSCNGEQDTDRRIPGYFFSRRIPDRNRTTVDARGRRRKESDKSDRAGRARNPYKPMSGCTTAAAELRASSQNQTHRKDWVTIRAQYGEIPTRS